MMDQYRKIFLVGIGGIGMSALARILAGHGKQVSGSDMEDSELIRKIRKEGIVAVVGHRRENLPEQTDLLIYSQAVPADNAERKKAGELGIKQLSYPEGLALVLEEYFVIAIAGTNGKTTTTGMASAILEEAGLDPTVLIGSKMKRWDSNARIGRSKYFVLEADEYRRGFLNYKTDIAAITNIAADHLDYFKDEQDVRLAFDQFQKNVKPGGRVIYDPNPEIQKRYRLRLPGEYNQLNAQVAARVARALGVTEKTIERGLADFEGTWRRWDLLGRIGQTDVISDYAHHPDGVRVLLKTAAEVYKKVLFVYQPHQHNRTKMLFSEFVRAFCEGPVNDIIFVEIFDVAGREQDRDRDVSSKDLAREISKCKSNVAYAADLREAEVKTRAAAGDFDAVFIVGAGDIYLLAEALIGKRG